MHLQKGLYVSFISCRENRMCHSFKFAGTVSTDLLCPQITCIKQKIYFFKIYYKIFITKIYFIIFRVRIIIKLIVFSIRSCSSLNGIYIVLYIHYWKFLLFFNLILLLQVEIALKFCTTVFPLVCRMLYDKKNMF